MLGDIRAIRATYPRAVINLLNRYENDSICGTWELLADAVYNGGSSTLKNKGWQAVGREKSSWSKNIAPRMDVDNNASPQFLLLSKEASRTCLSSYDERCPSGKTRDVVELPEKLCSHRQLEEVGWRPDMDAPLGNTLQYLHRQGVTEPPIQFIPIIQKRPVVAPGKRSRVNQANADGPTCSGGWLRNLRA